MRAMTTDLNKPDGMGLAWTMPVGSVGAAFYCLAHWTAPNIAIMALWVSTIPVWIVALVERKWKARYRKLLAEMHDETNPGS